MNLFVLPQKCATVSLPDLTIYWESFAETGLFIYAVTSSSSRSNNCRRFSCKYTNITRSDVSLIQFTAFPTESGVDE